MRNRYVRVRIPAQAPELQWGRITNGCGISGIRYLSMMPSASFNGAASLMDAESITQSSPQNTLTVSFNGAASLMDAESLTRRQMKIRLLRFNGAASLMDAESARAQIPVTTKS